MRATVISHNAVAQCAIEGSVEPQYLNSQLTVEPASQVVGVIKPVIIADSGVVTPHDKVGSAVVAPDDGVEYRFPGAGIKHRRGQHT